MNQSRRSRGHFIRHIFEAASSASQIQFQLHGVTLISNIRRPISQTNVLSRSIRFALVQAVFDAFVVRRFLCCNL